MKALVVCETSLSARVLARRMEREIARHGVAGTVEADAREHACGRLDSFDVVLLAPQAAWAYEAFQEATTGTQTHIWAITRADYERRNAKKLANDLLAAVGE